jgi:hypothetical protein
LAAVFFWWTGLNVATKPQVALVLGVALAWLAAFAWLQTLIFFDARWDSLGKQRFWLAALFVLAALATARAIVLWIPNVTGVGWQLTSVGLRFLQAWLLANAAWAGLAWQASAPPGEDLAPAVTPE